MKRFLAKCLALAFVAGVFTNARAESVVFEGQTITFTGAETNWVGGELVLKYTDTTQVGTLSLPGAVQARMLVVGGGGAGASPASTAYNRGGAGGGGAGGMVELDTQIIPNGLYKIYVGAGGAKGTDTTASYGQNGRASAITNDTTTTQIALAYGGGGGGLGTAGDKGVGNSGGSGGGGSAYSGTIPHNGGESIGGQGNIGGAGTITRAGGGGGGASTEPVDDSKDTRKTKGEGCATHRDGSYDYGGDGGDGKESDITGSKEFYAAGGGGGTRASYSNFIGVGGSGGSEIGGNGGYGSQASGQTAPTQGLNGTGSGGGGGCYNKAGAAGGSGVVIIRIAHVMPRKPIVFAEYQYGVRRIVYTNSNPTAMTLVDDQTKLEVAAIDTATMTEIRDYTFTSKLKPGYVWADGTDADATTTVRITKAMPYVESFTVEGWQEKDVPHEPVIVLTNSVGEVMSIEGIKFKYRAKGEATWLPWDTAEVEKLAAGTYEAAAEIPETEKYVKPADPTTTWDIWPAEAVCMGLGYSLKFTFSSISAGGTVFPVHLREGYPEGFSYRQVQPDGSDIRFVAGGSVLPMRVETWNPDGESVFWIQLPSAAAPGGSYTMCWGQLVDEAGADIPVPEATRITAVPAYWFDFENTVVSRGSSNPKTLNADSTTPAYSTSGLTAVDNAMTGWQGHSDAQLTFPTSGYRVDCVAKLSKTSATNPNIVWTLGTKGNNGGFGLLSFANGKVRLAKWSANAAHTTIVETNVPDATDAYHRYCVTVKNNTSVELFVDGVSKGTGTINVPTVKQLQFGSIHGGVISNVNRDSGYSITDWSLTDLTVSTFLPATAGHIVTAPNAIFKNRWIVAPVIPAKWGTGEEPKPATLLGDPAYGASFWTIADAKHQVVITNEFPTSAGLYYVTVQVPSDHDRLKAWQQLVVGEFEVQVSEHSPYSDLGGSKVTREGRVLLCNDYFYEDEKQKQEIVGQDYTNLTGTVQWIHSGNVAPADFPNLKDGSSHLFMSTNAVDALCSGTNIWQLTDAYIGNIYGTDRTALSSKRNYLPSDYATTGQPEAHIVFRNRAEAAINSPCYSNGIGTVYFDAVNGWTSSDGADYKIVVEYARGITESPDEVTKWERCDLIPLKRNVAVSPDFQREATTKELGLAIANGGSAENFYRIAAQIDVREPVRFRIYRTTAPDSSKFSLDEGGFILIDNIVVSYPASRAELSTVGYHDGAKTGEAVLGYEGACDVKFPSINDSDTLHPKAKAEYTYSPGSTKKPRIDMAKLHYRWRYLNQTSNDWQTVVLDKETFEALQPLQLPKGRVGDVEFYYELTENAPYYKYYDYSGCTGLSSPLGGLYTEEIECVTNHLDSATMLPSGGTDWFFRLREGESESETFRAIVQTAAGADYATVDFTVFDNHLWRGFLKTPDVVEGGFRLRLEETLLKATDPLAITTNRWKLARSLTEIPEAVGYVAGGADQWTGVPCDAATGYLMIQLDDSTKTVTILHADRQTFNTWNDAHKSTFVGSSTEDGKKSGVSSKMRDYTQDFKTWTDTPATNRLWGESFNAGTGHFTTEYPPFIPFVSKPTPNGWTAENGMWVNQRFKLDGASGAFQLEGCGYGTLTYLGATDEDGNSMDPRGLESISYQARLAQSIAFNDMVYNYTGDRLHPTNDYTFAINAAMSKDGWTGSTGTDDFDGAGQLSVVACYRPGTSCYEFRMTRTSDRILRFELYKWSKKNGVFTATALKTGTDAKATTGYNGDWGSTALQNLPFFKYRSSKTANWQYGTLYISVEKMTDGSKRIQAGYSRNRVDPTLAACESTGGYFNLCYWDTEPLADGAYGLASANCPAEFIRPRSWPSAVTWLSDATTKDKLIVNKTNNAVTWPTTTRSDDATKLPYGWWVVPEGCYAQFTEGTLNGFRAEAVPQKLALEYNDGSGEWKGLATNTVSGYKLSSTVTVPFYRLTDALYRLKHGGAKNDARTDIVIDSVQLRQWRGGDFGTRETRTFDGNDDEMKGKGWPTNFVFTSGWMKDHVVQLCAKRTASTKPCSVRSPLMDGQSGRGLGLGMISFTYGYVHPNANLLVQIATNNVRGSVTAETQSVDPGVWTTVTNFNAAALAAGGGVKSVYFGLHGVSGLMRIVIDPKVSEAALKSNDADYGRVDITSVLCRDEPELDLASWWGWNVHMANDDPGIASIDDGTRMYLTDYDRKAPGLSLVLNHSATADLPTAELPAVKTRMPFVQTPTFVNNRVGELSFRARMCSNVTNAQWAEVRLYGSTSGDLNIPETEWLKNELAHFVVSNTHYRTFHYRAEDSVYRAFRLGVSGVSGVDEETRGPGPTVDDPATGKTAKEPVRVVIEDVIVGEAVYPRVGFVYAYPVRTQLTENRVSPAVKADGLTPNPDEQPILGENWTLQTAVSIKQLPDEIDLTKPVEVLFHWFGGNEPWGYRNWKAKGKTAALALAEGEKISQLSDGLPVVFRGSLRSAPGAIVDECAAATNVQYAATVVFWDKSGAMHSNTLESTEWKRPAWYDPIDLNAGKAAGDFSAYTMLDGVSPGRAWINEANVFDGRTSDYTFPADKNQYIEIAVPAGQSLEGWHLEWLQGETDVTTNKFCFFGSKSGMVKPSKEGPETNDYVFIVVQNPGAAAAGTWSNVTRPDGKKVEIDGTWMAFDGGGGVLAQSAPIALRLVRPSGVVEQEIALEGRNPWGGWGGSISLEGFVAKLNADDPLGHYYAVGSESNNTTVVGLKGQSLNVVTNTGATQAEWRDDRHQTPGWCNEGQVVPKGWAIFPNGAMIVITARLDGSGKVRQTVGDAAETFDTVRVSAEKGGAGTNVTYLVDTWYELKSVTLNDEPTALPLPKAGPKGSRIYELNVGKGCSNNIAVLASVRKRKDLEENYGLDGKNAYAAAVMAWLEGGKNFFGEEFKNPGEISLGEFRDLTGAKVADLSLTDMYWLDMDPTEGSWWLQGGVSKAPQSKDKPVAKQPLKALASSAIEPTEEGGGIGITTNGVNVLVSVKLFMTNLSSHATYAPYVLRGVEPGSTSAAHDNVGTGNWSSVTFKVTGDLQNDNPNRVRWVPLRWFYFLPDTTGLKANRSASFDENNEAEIEIWDPFDTQRSSLTSGWEKYKDKPVWYRWAIDTRNVPMTVEPLKPDSTY